ncbi:lactoylglutathione lyase [Burkholderia pseudomallei]|nr:lactoylglutathione lyase [Burkholderia pseudomallei]
MSRPARATRRRPPRAARKAIMESFPGGIFPYAARIARLAARRSAP